ncbi:unnamed protein product [Tetraodon nigroviridis]|uniref:(spotted green pufferfish) hypothetical protein n=1 Tax=Tetraodon nigroviridis TaxID=99883 RepID=Q4RP03_TETNG|nr:unnamed protein product [Tetraodon nigroviridis]
METFESNVLLRMSPGTFFRLLTYLKTGCFQHSTALLPFSLSWNSGPTLSALRTTDRVVLGVEAAVLV